jgi:uncharacterized repeat protein (TIGR01451 family)
MKRQHKKNNSMLDTSSTRDVLFTLLTVFVLVFYQCLIPFSLAVAEDEVASDSATEEVEDDGDEDDGEDDEEEQEEESDEEAEDSEEQEEDSEDEESEQDDEVEEDSGDVETEDVQDSEVVEEAENEGAGEDDLHDEDESACEDECPTVAVENTNDTEIVNDADVDVNTGENTANGNGGEENEETGSDAPDCLSEEEIEDLEVQCAEQEGCVAEEEIDYDNICTSDEEADQLTDEETEIVDEAQQGEEQIEQSDENADGHESENEEGSDEDNEEEENEECEEGDILCEAEQFVEETAIACQEEDNCPHGDDEEESESVTEIITGEAQAIINILNEVNSNIVGSNWAQLIYDIQGLYEEDIDLFAYFQALLENASDESIASILEIYNDNVADITNTVDVDVNTGENTASDNEGDVNIDTGDAAAGANVVNIANQNLVGNNWLFAVINVFGVWTGDLIVPGEGLLDVADIDGYSNVEIINDNNADIENNVDADANTGDNTIAENGGDGVVATGEANSIVNVVDIVNTNIVGDNWFFLMINNMGSWTGNILHWNDELDGYQTVFSYVFESLGGLFETSSGALTVHNTNEANIQNDVTVEANTGDNTAQGNDGDTTVSTGDALAWVNIFNFINTNIVGNNWMFAIVNVMGEWSGDTVFAYPDLEITIDDGADSIPMDDALTYVVSYRNTGEAAAESVEVMVALPGGVKFHSSSQGSPSSSDGEYVWNVSGVEPGESGSFTVTASVEDEISADVEVESVAAVRTQTAEAELENNYASDHTTVAFNGQLHDSGNEVAWSTYSYTSGLALSRASNAVYALHAGDTLVHQIALQNTGNSPLYDIDLTDEIRSAAGEVLVEYEWDVGDLDVDETTVLEYVIIVSDGLNSSEYQFHATAIGTDEEDEDVESNEDAITVAIAGGWMHVAQEEDEGFHLIPEAHAKEVDAFSVDADEYEDASFWVWFISILLYALVINWTLFPKKKNTSV